MKAVLPGVVALLALLSWLTACGTPDPQARILEERARWTVTLSSWARMDDGTLALNLRLSGPVNAKLDRLTVKFLLLDAAGQTLGEQWRTLDLSDVERGGPAEQLLRLPAPAGEVEGVGIDPVLAPAPHELPRIAELSS